MFNFEKATFDYFKLPENLKFGDTHSVQELPDGRIVIVHDVHADSPIRDCVVFFSEDGKYLESWGAELEQGAHGCEVFHHDNEVSLLITHQSKGLFNYTLEGELIWHFDKPALYKKNFFLSWGPTNCATYKNRIYLADGYGTGFIIVIDENGKELSMFGGPGTSESSTIHPHGIGIDERDGIPKLAVMDNLDSGIHYFTLEGQHISKNASHLRDPRHCRVYNDIMIIPDLCGVVTILDKNNQLMTHLGDAETGLEKLVEMRELPTNKLPKEHFVLPHDACLLKNGNLIVTEWVSNGRVCYLPKN